MRFVAPCAFLLLSACWPVIPGQWEDYDTSDTADTGDTDTGLDTDTDTGVDTDTDTGVDTDTDTGVDTDTDTGVDTDTDTGGDTDTAVPTVTIPSIQAGTWTGVRVRLEDVVVVGRRLPIGIFVAAPGSSGANTGLWVYMGTGADTLAVGSLVDVEGLVTEYAGSGGTWPYPETEIDASGTGSVTWTGGSAGIPAATPVALSEFASPQGPEPYEGVRIVVDGLLVQTSSDANGKAVFEGNLAASRQGYDFGLVGIFDTYEVTGLLAYDAGGWYLVPQAAEDVVFVQEGGVKGVTEIAVGDLVINEVMFDPSYIGENPCGVEDDFEYIELLNTSIDPIALDGLVVKREIANPSSSDTTIVSSTTILEPDDFAVGIRSNADAGCLPLDAAFRFTFPLANNDRRTLVIGDGTREIDRFPYADTGFPNPPQSKSYQLAAGVTSPATANDTPGNWCPSHTDVFVPGQDIDHGTPGDLNHTCP